jgi:hypothetical protein
VGSVGHDRGPWTMHRHSVIPCPLRTSGRPTPRASSRPT